MITNITLPWKAGAASFKRLLGGAAGAILISCAQADSQGTEHHTAEVHCSHDRVQHRVTLDRGGGMVHGDQKLQHHEGDRDRPTADRIVRPERPDYHDVHREIPEGDLALPPGSDAPSGGGAELRWQPQLS